MKTEIVGVYHYVDRTDYPRELTETEISEIAALDRLSAVKRHVDMTGSTLAAAVAAVDRIQTA